MAKLADEAIERARQLDLLTYLQMQQPWELVPIGLNRYRMRTHDSLKIDHGTGGRAVLAVEARWIIWSQWKAGSFAKQ